MVENATSVNSQCRMFEDMWNRKQDVLQLRNFNVQAFLSDYAKLTFSSILTKNEANRGLGSHNRLLQIRHTSAAMSLPSGTHEE